MKRPVFRQPDLEQLEAREVPAAFGNAWYDPGRLTVSFAPDGTGVGTDVSRLSSLLGQSFTEAAWQTALLKAIQAWAVHANLNVGLVRDSGAAFGSSPAAQYDPRFGDIRFGAITLSANALAQSMPYQPHLGAWSGDVLLNNNVAFGNGQNGTVDLFTVALQEVGHALGLDNSPNASSAMFDDYRGVRTGLDVEDVASIQALYGARLQDAFDSVASNDAAHRATLLGVGTRNNPKAVSLLADVTTADDVDFYRFKASANGATRIQLRTAGLSLLTGRLTVYDADRKPIAEVANTDPLRSGDLTLSLNLTAGRTYYIRVAASAGSPFNVGGYQLQIVPPLTRLTTSLPSPISFAGRDGKSLKSANELVSQNGTSYDAVGLLTGASDGNYHRFEVLPAMAGTGAVSLTVASLGNRAVAPGVELYSATGARLVGKVLVNENGATVVQFVGTWQEGEVYYARIVPPAGKAFGVYSLGVTFQQHAATFDTIAQTTLSQSQAQASQSLTVGQSELYHFVLSATGTQSTAGVRMTLLDAHGQVVATLVARAGQTITTRLWLPAGNYTVVYAAGTSDGALLRDLAVTLQTADLGDSIDPYVIDPTDSTTPPAGTTPPPGVELVPTTVAPPSDYDYTALVQAMLLGPLDPFSKPFWY